MGMDRSVASPWLVRPIRYAYVTMQRHGIVAMYICHKDVGS